MKKGKKKKKISECKKKIGGGAVDFVLMMPIHDTRFQYHDLIAQIPDLCWQGSNEKYTGTCKCY